MQPWVGNRDRGARSSRSISGLWAAPTIVAGRNTGRFVVGIGTGSARELGGKETIAVADEDGLGRHEGDGWHGVAGSCTNPVNEDSRQGRQVGPLGVRGGSL